MTDERTRSDAGEQTSPSQGPVGTYLGRGRQVIGLLTGSTFLIAIVLVGILVFFSIYSPSAFATAANVRNIGVDAAALLLLAVGETYVIITAGIDLSVGSVLIFSGVVGAKVMLAMGGYGAGVGTIVLGFFVCAFAGLGWGAINGFFSTVAKVPPLIVTLGTLGIALGAADLLTGGVDVRTVPQKLNSSIGNGTVLGVPWLVIIALIVTVIFGALLAFTRFGRYTYAIGSNAEGARRAGIAVNAHLIKVYMIAGFLSGFAGFLTLAEFTTTTIGGHSTDNLNAIAAVVIGGTSLFGGVGTVIGTLIGVLIPAALQDGFTIIGVQPFWESIAVGAVLIAAVYVDQMRRSRLNRA